MSSLQGPHNKVDELFAQAVETPASERADFLARHCPDDRIRASVDVTAAASVAIGAVARLPQVASEGVDLVSLFDALEELAKRNELRARVVELRFFGGLDDDEIGEELGVTGRTVRNDWRFARAWLRAALEDDG